MIISVPINGITIRVPEEESGMIEQIFSGREYGAVPWSELTEISVVVDIGANIGVFAAYVRHRAACPTIHCFEPNETIAELLQVNAPFAHIHPIALGGMDAQAVLRVHAAGSFAASLRVPMVDQPSDLKLVTIRNAGSVFDEIGIAEVDVLKIDAEGFEVEILRSLAHRLERVRFVLVEYHSETDRRMIDSLMSRFLLLAAHVHSPGLGVLTYKSSSID